MTNLIQFENFLLKRNVITGLVGLILSACTTTPYLPETTHDDPETYYKCFNQNRWSDASHEYVATITRFLDHDGIMTFDSSGFYVDYKTTRASFNINLDRAKLESPYVDQSLTADLRYTTQGLPADSHIDIEFPNGVVFRSGPSLERFGYSPNLTANWLAFKIEMDKYDNAQLITRNPEEKVVDQRAFSLVPLRAAEDKYLQMDKDMNQRMLTFATNCTLETVEVVVLTD